MNKEFKSIVDLVSTQEKERPLWVYPVNKTEASLQLALREIHSEVKKQDCANHAKEMPTNPHQDMDNDDKGGALSIIQDDYHCNGWVNFDEARNIPDWRDGKIFLDGWFSVEGLKALLVFAKKA